MIIIDISQEVFGARTYGVDPKPGYSRFKLIAQGGSCNSTEFHMGVHNGTHVDAPWHVLDDGKTVDQMRLEDCIGPCVVLEGEGWERRIPDGCTRVLVRTEEFMTIEQARALTAKGIRLVGTICQKIGERDVHEEFLSRDIVILEGLDLSKAPAGEAFLCAQPLNLGGAEGAPVRAVLLYGVTEA
ncbi:MAG: cyclase family protein [Firmicutes bacterium]|nr:cyclase family protein [Bacillota bacterium]